MVLPSLSGHQLVVFWTELASLVLVARLLGTLARRCRQPAVVGYLVAGLLLGPSVLGHLSSAALHWFLPAGPSQGNLLTTVSQVSLLLVLVIVGAETDVPLIRSLGPAAVSVSLSSLLFPLAAGLGVATLLPTGFRADHHDAAFLLLIGGAVGVSSLPVLATILGDLGLLRRTFAQLALAAGTVNDTVGFLLATAATGLAASGSGSRLPVALGGLVVVVLVVFTVGQRAIDAVLRQVRRHGPNVAASITVAVVAACAAAAVTQALGLEGALGGFLAGIALGRSRFQQGAALDELRRFSDAVLAPLFFATAGLRVDLAVLGRPAVAVATAALVAAAVVVKVASGFVGARLAGLSWRDGAALGTALNGRGTLQVIIAGAGLSAGVFTTTAYTVVIVLAIASSVAIGPVLSSLVAGWQGSPEEQARLDEEARLDANTVVRGERLLLATGGSPSAVLAASVLHQAWPRHLPVTVLSVGEEDDATARGRGARWMFPDRQVEVSQVRSHDVLGAVLAETRLGYGVLGLGASDAPSGDRLLSAVVDDLLTRCPIPMVVARRARPDAAATDVADRPGHLLWSPRRPSRPAATSAEERSFRRILVPVAGTAASHAAQEVACGLAASQRSELDLLHVLTRQTPERGRRPLVMPTRPDDVAGEGILRDAARFADRHGVRAHCLSRRAPVAGAAIVRLATETEADLIVLGTVARSLDGRPFLGHTVEHVLSSVRAAVVVVVLPTDQPPGPPDEGPDGPVGGPSDEP
jgi:Kef-type K+ transport system membrane component KefB/nucleotide-binding universal stress UspA family protein